MGRNPPNLGTLSLRTLFRRLNDVASRTTITNAAPSSRRQSVKARPDLMSANPSDRPPHLLLSPALVLLCAMPAAGQRDGLPLTAAAIRAAAAGLPRLRSLLVSRHGTSLFEYYAAGAGPARVENVKSVSKSIISTLVGIAIDRRILEGVSQPIVRFFPEVTKDPDPRKARISVEDLLTMRSGLESTSFDNYGAWVRSRNWVAHVLNQPLVSEPGNSFEYSTGSTHLLLRS
jgi:CubicO group peptidase (beta-lactamase class C family)